jgi:predicted transcriptional regulator of viral defense system
MLKDSVNISLVEWVDSLMARGKIAFSIEELKQAFPNNSDGSLKQALNRLFKKKKAVSIHKGYYLLITPQYQSRGILPPSVYLDALMKHLNRPYYVGLLNAAAFHGSAHQQPQEYFVFTSFPQLRPVGKKGMRVNYISIKELPEKFLETRKTESGYLKISSPELTAIDLIHFSKRIGGLSRAATVLNELTEELSLDKLNASFLAQVSAVSIQRLGYLLEKILNKKEIAEHLYNQSKNAKIKFYRKPLSSNGGKKGFAFDEKWKLIINTEIEPD